MYYDISGDIMREVKKEGLKLIILDILKDSELHGYGISEKIKEIYGIDKPSSGIIYPALSILKRRGFIKICAKGRREKKVYSITPKGLNYLEEKKDELERAKIILRNLGDFYSLGGREIIKDIEWLVKNLHELDSSQREKISKILREMHEKLQREGMKKYE